jgi:hypothetical protein
MELPASKEQLLQRIRSERAGLDAVIAGLPDDRLSEPGVTGDWSIKDVMAHVTWWELRTMSKLNGDAAVLEEQGEDPEETVDRINERVFAEHHDQPVIELKAAYGASFRGLMESLTGFAEPHLLANLDTIAADTYGHYAEHREGIQAWLAQHGH